MDEKNMSINTNRRRLDNQYIKNRKQKIKKEKREKNRKTILGIKYR